MLKICTFACIILILLSSQLMAQEISSIRYGKTIQIERLVIDSKLPLDVNEIWLAGQLSLELKELSIPLSNSVISPEAVAIGVKIVNEQNASKLIFPFKQENFIRRFTLNAIGDMPFRTVIDWRTTDFDDNLLATEIASTTDIEIPPETVTNITPPEQHSLRESAETALTEGKYKLAISLLTKLLNNGNSEDIPFAIEFLGVAREKNYQLAFAKQYYQRFLAEYSQSANAPRVKQRLNALIGIQNLTQTKTLKAGSNRSGIKTNITRGSISSDYRNSRLTNDLGDSTETISLLSVDFDIRGDYLVNSSSVSLRFSAGHFEDLQTAGNATDDRLRYANIGWKNSDKTYSLDIGRQRSRGKGIFGRFDGAVFGYKINTDQGISVVAGYPVASTKDLSLDPERSFLGVSFDWADLFPDVDMNLFFIEQSIGNLIDRRAIGGEFKYFKKSSSIYGLIDYDMFFSELNALLISGSFTTENSMRYYWSYNQRKSPYISTRNALIGQTSDSLADLQNLFLSDDDILDLAVDRTLESKTATFQASKPLNGTYDLSASITYMDISGAPASGGVSEIIDTNAQFYMNIYLRASKLYSDKDTNQLGLRLSNLSNGDVWSIFGNSQYRISKSWTANAKFRFDSRTNDNGSEQQSISPGFRVQYQNKNNYFYSELGAIFYNNQTMGLSDISTDIYFLYLGYRYFF